jgi:hypothetical protein
MLVVMAFFSEVSVNLLSERRDDQSERKSDRRHETIAPFLPVRMRTGLIMDLDPVGTGQRNLRTELV